MKYIFYTIILFFLFSCKKPEDRRCFKSIGDEISITRQLDDFSKIKMGKLLKFRMVQDTVNKVILTGGKNLLNFIRTDIENGQLIVENQNKCNFLRKFDKKVTVEVHFKNVVNIEFNGSEEVEAVNQLQTDYLSLYLSDGSGKFNLNVNAKTLYVMMAHGFGNFEIKGNVDYLRLEVRTAGFGSTYGLQVKDSIHAISKTVQPIKINANNCLIRTQTHSSGDIWYIGNPTFIEHFSYAEGELIDKN